MFRTRGENGPDAVRGINATHHPALRILGRCAAFLLALVLLQALVSCRGPYFTESHLQKDRIPELKTFSIDRSPDPNLFIWDMRPIPFEELRPLVSDRLREKGYRLTSPQEADFRIILTTFTEESSPRSRIAVMEIYERTSSQILWSGHAEIPYQIDPSQGVENQPALIGLMDLIPPRNHPMPTPSSAHLKD